MSLLKQYEEAIDAFEAALRACPPALWTASLWKVERTDPWIWPRAPAVATADRTDESIQVFSAFWYVAFHCLFFLDFYLSGPDAFEPLSPFRDEGLDEDMAAILPSQRYTRAQLLRYLSHCRKKARAIIPELTEEDVRRVIPEDHPWAGQIYNTLLRVNLRHVREHGRQMARFLEKAG